MSNPAKTIRKLASRAPDDRKALFEQLATEMEVWENRLNNNFQAALGLTELHLTERLDALEALLRQHLEKVGDVPQSRAVNDDASTQARSPESE